MENASEDLGKEVLFPPLVAMQAKHCRHSGSQSELPSGELSHACVHPHVV